MLSAVPATSGKQFQISLQRALMKDLARYLQTSLCLSLAAFEGAYDTDRRARDNSFDSLQPVCRDSDRIDPHYPKNRRFVIWQFEQSGYVLNTILASHLNPRPPPPRLAQYL